MHRTPSFSDAAPYIKLYQINITPCCQSSSTQKSKSDISVVKTHSFQLFEKSCETVFANKQTRICASFKPDSGRDKAKFLVATYYFTIVHYWLWVCIYGLVHTDENISLLRTGLEILRIVKYYTLTNSKVFLV